MQFVFFITCARQPLTMSSDSKRSGRSGSTRKNQTQTRSGDSRQDPPDDAHTRHLIRVAGLSAVKALFQHSPESVVRLFYEDRKVPDIGEFCSRMAQQRRPYRKVENDELAKISGTVLHGGIVAVAKPQPEHLLTLDGLRKLAATGQTLFVLDGIGNPHNVGAIARSLAFFGFQHLVLSGHPAQAGLSDAAYRIAEGGLHCLKIHRAKELPYLITHIRSDYRVVGTSLDKSARSLECLDAAGRPIMVIFGNEESGLTRTTQNACECLLKLSAAGDIQSLNVSATAAIISHHLSVTGHRAKTR